MSSFIWKKPGFNCRAFNTFFKAQGTLAMQLQEKQVFVLQEPLNFELRLTV